jgi:hypothetical protein
MAGLDTAALTAVLKLKYTQRKFHELCYKTNRFHARVKKNTDFGGEAKVVALRNGTPQGRSASFPIAQQNVTPSVYNRFVVTTVKDYAIATITGEAIRKSKGRENALIEGLSKEIDAAIFTCMRSIAVSQWRNGGGARGKGDGASNVATATWTLGTTADVTNFEVNMILQASSDDGTGGAGVRPGTLTVTAVDRVKGILTFAQVANGGIPAIVNTDFLFQQGDYNAMMAGVPAWLKGTAITANDSFFSLNRFSDSTRLGGITATSSGNIEDTLIDAAALAGREGATPDEGYLNPLDYSQLVKSLGAKVVYDRAESFDEPDIGFKAVMLDGPEGPIKILSDLNVQKGKFALLTMDTWSFESAGEAPGILEEDGNMILRSANLDQYEVRIGYYGNLMCEAPGLNVFGTL